MKYKKYNKYNIKNLNLWYFNIPQNIYIKIKTFPYTKKKDKKKLFTNLIFAVLMPSHCGGFRIYPNPSTKWGTVTRLCPLTWGEWLQFMWLFFLISTFFLYYLFLFFLYFYFPVPFSKYLLFLFYNRVVSFCLSSSTLSYILLEDLTFPVAPPPHPPLSSFQELVHIVWIQYMCKHKCDVYSVFKKKFFFCINVLTKKKTHWFYNFCFSLKISFWTPYYINKFLLTIKTNFT